jgi:hypothetical protein
MSAAQKTIALSCVLAITGATLRQLGNLYIIANTLFVISFILFIFAPVMSDM